ncbi:uncharacterized protein HD556DRAFT_1378230 [Suillus plorans]|uniref:Uncharacterized protein n=1 Tax=Suillus plorans TaxID=116603 RepID=A0A9P7AMV9_9AGAM|nr:uncharacterized protein HD556DRAFT_1378230 [Suillus plorans]KAG1792807.1 hypothetical protein HD556DRAFT_1378230 [Suillus plorans]
MLHSLCLGLVYSPLFPTSYPLFPPPTLILPPPLASKRLYLVLLYVHVIMNKTEHFRSRNNCSARGPRCRS